MNIWEKLKENPADFTLSQGDEFQNRLGQIRWKDSPEAAKGLACFAKSGNGEELARLYYECRREQENGFSGVGRHRPLNAYVLAKLVSFKDGEEYLWLGREYLRRSSLLRDAGGEKAVACFQKAIRAGQWKQVMEIGFSLLKEGCIPLGIRILEMLLRECGEVDEESGKKICRTLGTVCLNGKLNPPESYRGEKWLKYSVEKYGDENTAYVLGKIYREGKVLHEDRTAALKYLTYAAEKGHSEAGLFMVRGFLEGDPVLGKLDIDIDKVIPYLTASAGNLNPEAIYYAGILNCLCADFDTATEYMENVKLERSEAYGILGQIYFIQEKYEKAWMNLKIACEEKGYKSIIEPLIQRGLGDINSMSLFPSLTECMGRCFHLGLGGCPQDAEKAFGYYEETVRRGYAGPLAYHFLAEQLFARGIPLNELHNPAREKERWEERKKGLFYWEEAVSRSENQYFMPPCGIGNILFLFELKEAELDAETKILASRCLKRLEEYAYRVRQCFKGEKEEGQILYEYAHCIYSIAKTQKSTEIRNKLGDEMAVYLDLAVEAGSAEACYDRARIYYWHDQIDKSYEVCKKGADRGSEAAQGMLKHFKKKMFGGYVYKI